MRNDKVAYMFCCLHVTLYFAIFLYKANKQDFMCMMLCISLIPRKARISEVIDSCAFSFLAVISVLLFIHIGNLMDCSCVWYGLRKESGYKVFLFVGE